MNRQNISVPGHFDPARVGKVWKISYQELAEDAEKWSKQHNLRPASSDSFKICIIAVDVQNSFCIPDFELFVGGRTGTGAIDDNRRLCEFIYRNIDVITQICPTMDTHQTMQIFHAIYLVNDEGEHPHPFTLIKKDDIRQGKWRFNPMLSYSLGIDEEYGQRHLMSYAEQLESGGKYDLTIWPYHAMLGGIGHALVASVEEAIFFHSIARFSQPDFHEKGHNPLSEHYSVLGPEVLRGPNDKSIAEKSDKFFKKLVEFDAVIIAGQAKSHCVAWTIDDLLSDIVVQDRNLVRKIYLLEDCTSPVVIPGTIDFTDQADAAFRRYSDEGMHVVRSTAPLETWPGIKL